MSQDKKSLPHAVNILGSLSGKTLNALTTYQHGAVSVVELGFSDGTMQFIKFYQGQIEVGGTNEWGTGTKK